MRRLALVAFVAVMGMMVSSCGKDVDLANTTWNCARTGTYEVRGVEVDVRFDLTLKFNDATNGEDTMLQEALFMGDVIYSDGPTTTAFTYTFDGENGVITHTYEEEGETVTETNAFSYDKKSDVILMNIGDIEQIGLENPCQFTRQ